ncbi:MAG: hypothetical protein LLG44_00655, partial [Chloroflexi bacterium]|nr:hypothetical protein [Chloroflexota bacterium]
RLSAAYWQALAEPFRRYVLQMANPAARAEVQSGWITLCSQTAFHLFETTIAQIGDDAEALRERVLYTDKCRNLLDKIVQERSM